MPVNDSLEQLQNELEKLGLVLSFDLKNHNVVVKKNGARCRFRTCDPYRVKVMLYH